MKIHLTSEQRTALKMLHKSSGDLCVCDRIRCVLLADELIDETTVSRHLSDWLNVQKLEPEKWRDICYIIPGLKKWLHRNSFSHRKHSSVPHKHSVEAWLVFVETYKQADDDESILFIDGVYTTQGTKLTYGWMPAGKKAHVAETTRCRTRLNLMGTLNLNDMGKTVIQINSHIARFLIAIREIYPITQKVHIILNGTGYHRTEQIKELVR